MRRIIHRFSPAIFAILLLTLGVSISFLGSCSEEHDVSTTPQAEQTTKLYDISNKEISATIAVQNKYTEFIMENPVVVGIGTGLDENGEPAIIVFTKTEEESKSNDKSLGNYKIPSVLDNVPVVVNVSGEFEAFALKERYRPVPIGVSTGNNNECASGTLGCAPW